MHWVVQENLILSREIEELVRVLERMSLPYSLHKVVPFSGEIIPDINPPNPVVAFGAYSMLKVARRYGWVPGVWTSENFDFEIWRKHWQDHCLNADALIYPFAHIPTLQQFFMRPCMDDKSFAGQVFDWPDYEDWRRRVVDLGEDSGSTLHAMTPVLICQPKVILREYRLWVVDKRVATASLYKIGDRVRYDANVEEDIIDFGHQMASLWQPDRAFVLDLAMTEDGIKVIEINSLNAAGLYAANVGRLVEALEGMGY